MNKNPLKAHKGIDNRLIFRALGPDRVAVDVSCNQQVYARIIDYDNRTVVLEKLCKTGPAKGIITLELDSGDIESIHAGLYSMVLIRTEDFVAGVVGEYVEKPMFTDFDSNMSMEIEITEQAFKSPKESVIITHKDWTPDLNVPVQSPAYSSYYTQRIPGGRVLNHINAVHSFSTYCENFTGILEIWGSLEEAPDPYVNPQRWFKIYPSSMSQDIEFIAHTGTQAWTFSANFMWLKFRYIPSTEVLDPGRLVKLVVRV